MACTDGPGRVGQDFPASDEAWQGESDEDVPDKDSPRLGLQMREDMRWCEGSGTLASCSSRNWNGEQTAQRLNVLVAKHFNAPRPMYLPGSLALVFGASLILLVVSRRRSLARGDAGGAMHLFARLAPLIGALIIMGGSLLLHRDVLIALRTFGAAAATVGALTLALTWTSGGDENRDEPVVFAGGMTAPDFGALAFIIGIGLLAFALIL